MLYSPPVPILKEADRRTEVSPDVCCRQYDVEDEEEDDLADPDLHCHFGALYDI